jgi:8-oxo-dGTP pyrophosphatase MutT (NUDIX family)
MTLTETKHVRRAGIILYYVDNTTKQYHVLIGRESSFLQDRIETEKVLHPETKVPFTRESFSEYQSANTSSIREATEIFNWRAQELSLTLGISVKYDKIRFFPENEVYRVHFRIVKKNNYGIIKGSIEKNETPYCAALRELHEETGISLPKPKISTCYTIDKCIVYVICVDDLRDKIEGIISTKNRSLYGELFELKFIPLYRTTAKKFSKKSNVLSFNALTHMNSIMKYKH